MLVILIDRIRFKLMDVLESGSRTLLRFGLVVELNVNEDDRPEY